MTYRELSQLHREIKRRRQRLSEIESRAVRTTSALSGLPRSGMTDKVGQYASAAADLSRKLEILQAEFDSILNDMPPGFETSAIKMRICDGRSWKEIARLSPGFMSADALRRACSRYKW